ncbi:hypothetical protein O5626_30570, partial [Escherichia coli]|nr:hypothetical protein [Escherichia coli]
FATTRRALNDLIFKECRQSAAMKRVLAVYGVSVW